MDILNHINAALNIALVVLFVYGMRKLSKLLTEIRELITKKG